MALIREPEKQEGDMFQCTMAATTVRRWRSLSERASKQRINLRRNFESHFSTWLDEVEAELNAMTVRPIRSKAEE